MRTSSKTAGRLLNLKSCVSRFVKIGRGKIGTATLLAAILFGGNAFAADYIIDSTQSQSGFTYPTLNDLRLSPGIPTWNGDTITLKNNDASLMAVFYSGTPTATGKMSFSADPTALGTAGLTQFIIDGSTQTRTANSRFMNITGTETVTLELNDIKLFNFGVSGSNDGGAIYMNNGTTLNLIGSSITFDSNSAGSNGGAIRAYGDLSINGTSVMFSNNTANMGGAIINALVGSATVIDGNVSFSKNIANSSGSAIYSSGNLSFVGTTVFEENRAGTGTVFLGVGGNITEFSGTTTFTKNAATSNAGAVYANINSTTTYSGTTTFTENTATSSGGAVYAGSNSITTYSGDTTFDRNKAGTTGGAITIAAGSGTSTLNFTDGTNNFTGNEAGRTGGAVMMIDNTGVNTSVLNFSGGVNSFTGNKAGTTTNNYGGGGAIFMGNNSTLNFTGGTNSFTGNSSGNDTYTNNGGGAIAMSNGNIALNFSGGTNSFTGNTAMTNGGAILAGISSVITFSDGTNTFTGNKATVNGGAISTTGTITIGDDLLTFTGNEAGGHGGAIYSTGTLDFQAGSTTIFDSNKATGANSEGGAICFYYPVGSITAAGDMQFTNNTAGLKGGAISTNSAIVATGDMLFTGNIAGIGGTGGHGGAIYTITDLSLTGDTIIFNGNQATGTGASGGAIYQSYQSAIGLLTLGTATSSIEFKNNSSASNGGAIYTNSDLEITGASVTFSDNTAGVNGGAILNMGVGTTSTIAGNDVLFSNNTATDSGGAFYTNGDAIFFGTTTFTDNKTTGAVGNTGGGAVWVGMGNSTFSGITTFTNNEALGSCGGAVYAALGTSTYSGVTTFTNNSSTMGGAIGTYHWVNLDFTGTTTFDQNKATGTAGSGGAIYVDTMTNGSLVEFSAGTSTFTGNNATDKGGAIYMNNSCAGLTTLDFSGGNNSFSGNTAGTSGGAIYLNDNLTLNFTAGDNSFSDNEAGINGGAVYTKLADINFNGGTNSFAGNKAETNGGAIYAMMNADVNFTAGNNSFSDNEAGTNGGAIYVADANINFTNGTNSFSGNEVGTNGGAIYAANANINFTAGTNSFSGNEAGTNGGAIYAANTNINFTGGINSFSGNKATANGGAIWTDRTVDFEVSTLFTDNTAGGNGGAISTTDIITAGGNVQFTNNTAGTGGAVYTTSDLSLTGDSIIFNGNRATGATGSGGAIYQNSTTGSLTLGSSASTVAFTNNSAASNGGAISTNRDLDITGTSITFSGNTAGNNGGAVYSTGTFTIDRVMQFTGNTAGGRGGAIAMDGATAVLNIDATLYDQLFAGNTDSTGRNDIYLANGAKANFIVADGHNAFLADGITDQFNATPGGNQQSLTKTGLGTLTFGAGSVSYLHGNINIDAGTFRLENGASFGKVNNVNVGNVTINDGVTVSYQFGSNGIDHSWIQGDTITIADGVKFDLDGVIWQPDAERIYNLAESRFDANGGTMNVKLNVNRGSFKTNEDVANWSGQTAPDVADWFFRDFTYYVDDTGKIVKSFANGTHLGNFYAAELFRKDEVIGVDALYVDPSLKNRILSQRLDHCCTSCSATPECSQWNAWVQGYGTGGGVGNYNGRNGLDFSTGGMLVGIEKETADNHRFGLYYGYGSSWTTGRSISYNGKSENTFGGYLRIADQFGYTLLMGNLGHTGYRSSRFVDTALGREMFNANFGANTGGAYLERGFEWKPASHTCLTPFVALQYSNLSTNWYNETATVGSDARLAQTAKLGYDSLRTLIGARTQTMLYNRLNWNNAIHWEHEMSKNGAAVRDEYLTSNATLNARTVGNYGGRDWVVYGTGLEFAVTPELSFNAGYDLSFNKKSTFHTGMGGMTYTF